MSADLAVLCYASASLALVHTVLGPDHYIPFVAMSRAGCWSLRKTLTITVLCGAGHVLSSVVLGIIGMGLGVTALRLEWIESARGEVAAWLLLAFGLCYGTWGLRRAIRNRPHTHLHVHEDGTIHAHEHVHSENHLHAHDEAPRRGDAAHNGQSLTPWVLFTVFLFGPCEPLIPMLMYTQATGGYGDVAWVSTIFGSVTIATMTVIVTLAYLGVGAVRFRGLERYGHALAGAVVFACGVAIQMGL